MARGDMFRRFVSRALAAASVFDQATRPYQFALRTRVGVDALSARRRATLENDARATVVSLDGRSAYDCISRAAFLLKLCDVAPALVPFALALLFYGQTSEYHGGTTTGSATAYPKLRDVNKATDPLAPALFALGQHEALRRHINTHIAQTSTAEMDWCRVVGPRSLCRPLDENGFPSNNPHLDPARVARTGYGRAGQGSAGQGEPRSEPRMAQRRSRQFRAL